MAKKKVIFWDVKMKVIFGLSVLCIILGYTTFSKPKPISDNHTISGQGTGVTTSTTHSNAVITGATSATTLPNGSVAVSGSNLSIKTASDTATKAITEYVYKDKEVIKYNFNAIYIDGLIKSDLTNVNIGLGVTFANREFKILAGYFFLKPEYFLSAGKSVFVF